MSQQWKNSETGGDDDVQVPLGTGEGAAPEDVYVEKKPRMNSSTLTLFVAFAAALVALYLLGLQNKPRHANAEKIKAQEATSIRIDELSQQWGESATGLQGDIQRLVSILTKYLGTRQEESLDIGGNPFEREVAQSPFAGTTTAAPIIPTNTQDAAELRLVAETFNSLKLQSVIIGPTPVAMVNNGKGTVMISAGAKIGKLVVTSIQADRVLMKYKENVFELKSAGPSMDN